VVIIQTSTALVAGSGVEADSVFLQHVQSSTTYNMPQLPGIDTGLTQVQASGVEVRSYVNQFGGIDQDTYIITPSIYETTASGGIVVFPKDFSRGVFLSGVIGVSGSVERFFDRSPFFFSPHETDPNTLRDISEAQQFLMYSQIGISSYSIFTHNVSSTPIIAAKGDEFSDQALAPVNMFSSGNFENGFSN